MKELSRVLRAMANPRRLQIIRFIRDRKGGEATVGDVAEAIKLSFKSTSRHLSVLKEADILDREQRSVEAYYSLSAKRHAMLRQLLLIL